MKKSFGAALIALILVNSISCTKNDDVAPVLPPVVTTASVSDIQQFTATSGGTITSDGGSIVTERGICWSTGQTPTLADAKTSDGTGTGAFESLITGLNPSTNYTVRAYATNQSGTTYGNAITFTTRIACYLTSFSDPGNTLNLTYNSNNQVILIAGVSFGTSISAALNYDSNGNLSSTVYASGSTVFTYDGNNRLVSTSNGSSTTVYLYNSSGQLTSRTYTSGSFSETHTYTYPNTTTNNYTTETLGSSVRTFEYDDKFTPYESLRSFIPSGITDDKPLTDNNKTKKTVVSNGVSTVTTYTYVYNDNGFAISQTASSSGSTTVTNYTYECR